MPYHTFTTLMLRINYVTLTNKHQCFPFKSREPNNLLIRNHIQLVKNCKKRKKKKGFCFSIGSKTEKTSSKHGPSDTLTRAVLGQVLVFALLFLSKWAAGLAAHSGLAFTRHSPVVQTEVWVKM